MTKEIRIINNVHALTIQQGLCQYLTFDIEGLHMLMNINKVLLISKNKIVFETEKVAGLDCFVSNNESIELRILIYAKSNEVLINDDIENIVYENVDKIIIDYTNCNSYFNEEQEEVLVLNLV